MKLNLKSEATALKLEETTESIRKETKEFTTGANTDLKHLIESIDEKVTMMLADLRKRVDLTNGNVAMIRTEIADLQEDIQSLYDINSGDGEDFKQRKREQERTRRQRRRKIEVDRVSSK